MCVLGAYFLWTRYGNDIASRSRALNAVQCCREEMRQTTLWCFLCGGRRRCHLLLLSLALIATPPSAAGQENATFNSCSRCPEGQYNDLHTGCQPCTKCLGSLEERLPCANGDPLYCDSYGQFDRLCCEKYEYEAFGRCVLDCTKCEVSGKCKQGLAECDCPADRFGKLCQYLVIPSSPRTTAPPVTTTDTHLSETGTPIPLETWHFALIALGIVVGVVAFAALCVVGSFCQYNRRMLRRQTKPTVSSVIIDGRTSSTATMSSDTSSDSTHYLIAPPHTRICLASQRIPMEYP